MVGMHGISMIELQIRPLNPNDQPWLSQLTVEKMGFENCGQQRKCLRAGEVGRIQGRTRQKLSPEVIWSEMKDLVRDGMVDVLDWGRLKSRKGS